MTRFDVALLVGGRGSRLKSVTGETPKVLVDVGGLTFLEHVLHLLAGRGFRRAMLCVGAFSDEVRSRIGERTPGGIQITYSEDGPIPVGTAGAIRKAAGQLSDPFWVLNGDTYLDLDYAGAEQHFRESGQPGMLVVYRNDNLHWQSNVRVADAIVAEYDKLSPKASMRHVDAGAMLLRQSLLPDFPNAVDLGEIVAGLARRRRLAAYESSERFWEVNTPISYAEVLRHLVREG